MTDKDRHIELLLHASAFVAPDPGVGRIHRTTFRIRDGQRVRVGTVIFWDAMGQGVKCVLRVLAALLVIGTDRTLASDVSIEGDGSRPAIEVVEATIRAHAIIGFSWIDQPLNRIVLIRTRKESCAIRYLSFSKSPAAQEDGPFYGEAELYSKLKGSVRRLHLTEFPLRGSHLFSFGGGRPYFQCGHARIGWAYPTGTFLSADSDVHLASTQWEDFSKVDFQDRGLQWFGYEEGRKIVIR